MEKNVVMVVNPISGAIDKTEFINATKLFAKKVNCKLYIYKTSGKNDIANIKSLYDTYSPERIIIAGGDGTIKMVAEAIEKDNVILGVLPAGSSNGLAADLDLPETLEENLSVAFLNKYLEIDVIEINNEKSMHLSDLGLNAELIKNYEKSLIRGKWGYALQILTTIIDLEEPFKATITANNKTIECLARMIVIANAKKYGSGIIINPDGEMNDGKFELVILKNLDLIVLGKIITGNMPINSDDIEIISTDKATITTNSPVSFQMDGEYCGTKTRLDIKISPKRIKVAIP
ncbi:diacylglycerol/lipid kinase family protein [Flavobacterium luteum]|uniref:Diacylglycerol kinase n=1 Tax=Flavobacterium luteum TaxID=2026654 RepID=A0A7J5AG97_9FLAO|nr:diacylglycerol kinase family protein [Flavobacterium luteum]KAB1156647.1 diacylglycerol kinase [Flavobacterium luteum]